MKKTVIGMARTWDPLDVTGEVCRQSLERLESKEDLRVVTASREITCAEDARAVCLEFESAGVEFAILACCRLVGDGRVVEPFMRSEQELVVWCLPEPTREGPLLLNSMTCANLYMSAAHLLGPECGGKRAWWLYGAPEEALMEARLARILRGRRKALSGTTVVQIGDTAHGFTNLYCDQEALARNLGVAVRRCSLEDIFARMRQVDSGAAAALARTLPEGAVCCAASGMELELTARLILAVRQLKKEWNADAFAISCWPEFQQDLHVSTCYAFALLNQEGIPVSCEGDLPGALTMHLAKMAGGEAPMLMDLVAMDQSADAISFWHCGMGMPCHADAGGYALGKYPADPRVLDLPGISVDEKFAPGPVTICRLSGPWAQTLFVCQAQIVPGPDRGYDGARGWFSEFTMGGRPLRAAEFFDAVCQNGIPHHYVICRGHVEQALREMAACSRMETAALPVGWYSEVKECGR